MQKAVILLSGGLDSATTIAIARAQNYELYALSFRYGQRHSRELECASQLAEFYKVQEHKTITIDLTQLGGSALTDDNIPIPEGRALENISEEIPSTYVPARNTIFLSFALAYAEVLDADAIFIGANARDYSGYPDCRPEYYAAIQQLSKLCNKRGVEGRPIEIKYPLIDMTKSEIITKGTELGVPYELTWSCYQGGAKPCGKCDSCMLRAKGFKEAGLEDPGVN
ncbi:MAG: 7-cyano-7-deazaguanine synthase QueC [Thermoplasmata archaeon]|nr:7-cyano-7-deazaguanine synthase QueC [Thermoplasmata archaeon]